MATASVVDGRVPETIVGSPRPSPPEWEQSIDDFLKALDGRASGLEQSHTLYGKCVLITCSSIPEFKGNY